MNKKFYFNIYNLRYLASLMLVIYHFNGTIFDGNIEILNINYILASGVDLFFIISGFLMFDLIEKKDIPLSNFYLKGLIRLFPFTFLLL